MRNEKINVVVTGGAGFIGSHLVDYLVNKYGRVIVIDNLSSGRLENIRRHIDEGSVEFHRIDLKRSEPKELVDIIRGSTIIYHLAANPEVRVSVTHPRIHFEENVLATFNLLEACRLAKIKLLVFTSSSTVYGDAKKLPTPEDYSPLLPISVYGASKLACENLIITYSMLYGFKSLILRLANIVGPRQTHGVIIDFINKLKRNPEVLEILGDGTQKKSYLYIDDLLRAIEITVNYIIESNASFEVFNVGNKDWITVNEIADIVTRELGLTNVKYVYRLATKDGRGWVGDVKFMLLDISKLMKLGWRPIYSSKEAIRLTTKHLIKELGVSIEHR